jgi:hypothetical protein
MTSLNHIDLHIASPAAVDSQLDAAVDALLQAAMEDQQGVLVTRHSPRHYSVAVSAAVPFGTTMEQSY